MIDITPFVSLGLLATAAAVVAFLIHLFVHKSATNSLITTATTAINAIQNTAVVAINAQLAAEGVELNALPTPLRDLQNKQS